mgnify:CR=1 FL=1
MYDEDEAEADAREQWEADTPVESMMSRDDMSEIILELLYGSTDLALSVARYHADKAWGTYKKTLEEQDYGC